jgi:PAS domain S-box-containing protein
MSTPESATPLTVEAAAQGRRWRVFLLAAATSAALWLATGVLLSTPWLDAREKQLLTDSMLVLCPMPGVVYAWTTTWATTGRLRRTWLCLTATLGAWTLGNLVWFYNQVLAEQQAFPTIGDGFYVAALGFAGAALLSYPTGTRSQQGRSRLVLDGLSIGCSLLFISDALVLDRVLSANGSGLGAAVLVTYPVGDVLLASAAVLLLTRTPGRLRVDLGMVAVGLLVYAVGDTSYAFLGAEGRFHTGTPLDLAWLGGYLVVGLAALVPTARVDEHRARRRAGSSIAGTVLVYTVMGAAIAVGFVSGVNDAPEVVLSVGIIVLLGVRQTVLARDNLSLHADLEAKVAARTAQLEQLARHQRSILDAVGEGVYGIDVAGRVTFVNPAAARALGYQPRELVGEHAHDVFHGAEDPEAPADDATEASCASCRAACVIEDGDVVRRSAAYYLRRNGDRFPVELTAAPMHEADQVAGAVVVFSDISQRRAVERMKEEFVSVVSHELRTPLTAIRGSLGLLGGGAVGELPESAARMVHIALDNSDRLTRLINDILDLERIESGAVPLELGTHDAAAIVEATLTTGRPLAQAAGVVLVCGAAGGLVNGDADRIVQALTNLVGNAIKFSPEGGEVLVSAEREGAHVTFVVQDHGRGIPDDKLDSVFERFQQVDSSDAREKGGTGLGLAITKTIVERHGGRIWVDSMAGHGSAFRFTIPAATEPLPLPADPNQRHDAPTVLLCDDDPDILEILSRVLGQHGYATRPAARGREAVDLAVSSHPDAILVDLRMPGMTGWQAIAELKARPETRDIPIIVMSGLDADTDPELAASTDGWLTKPVDEREMARLLLSALSSDGRQPTVLVVEDDDDLASVLVTMFERQGLAVVRAASESEAVRHVRQARPDVLVLDLYLLDGDGFGVVDQLRRDGRLGEVPVVVYSAHPLDAASRERLRLGEMVFLTKGHTTPDDLVRRVVAVVHSMARRDHHHLDGTSDDTTDGTIHEKGLPGDITPRLGG